MFPISRFRIEDDSMQPSLQPGDFVVVNRWAYRFRGPARGDVVVLRDPERSDRFLVKRISEGPGEAGIGVVGDNVARSRDSRSFGPIARETIVGKVWLRLKK